MFEQAELPGTQMGPGGPPNAKGTAQIAPEIANSRKPGHLGHFGHFGQNGHFGHFGQPFPNQVVDAPEKNSLRVLLVSTRPSYFFLFLSKLDPPATGSQAKFSTAGCRGFPDSQLSFPLKTPRFGVSKNTPDTRILTRRSNGSEITTAVCGSATLI